MRRLAPAILLLLIAAPAAAAPDVVVSIRPVHSIASGVMAGVAEPQLLLQGTESPHTYALRPSDARRLARADLLIWIGDSVETFLLRAVETRQGKILTLEDVPAFELLPFREWPDTDAGRDDHHGHEEEHRGDHADHHGHGHHGHDHAGQLDGHLWLDPLRAQTLATVLADTLSELDPDNAPTYQANADTLRTRLAALHAEGVEMLTPVADNGFVMLHDAMQYFSLRFSLNTLGAIQATPGHTPSAHHLSALAKRLQAQGGVCLLSEPQFSKRQVESLARDLGLQQAEFDPLGAAYPPGAELYFKMMRANFATLRACLEGGAR